MTGLEIWLLAVGLAMDCLAVSIANGIILKHFIWKPIFITATAFGSFQAAMPLIGWTLASSFSKEIESFDHWIAFGILTFLGGRMIAESFKTEECKKGIDPTNLKIIFTMAIATSIDALAVGVSFAFLGMSTFDSIISPIIIIGLVSFLLSLFGLIFGIRCSCNCNHGWKVERWGGLILILIGSKILMEHLFYQ